MTLRKAIQVVVELAKRRVVSDYAITGAVAALNYIQPALTEDLDILVAVEGFEKRTSGSLLLDPIEKALTDMGYTKRTSLGFLVEGWPLQFLPVASPLDEEALANAVDTDLARQGEPALVVRCLRAEHLAAIALKVGRPKDIARIEAFIEQDVVDRDALNAILKRHSLIEAWRGFCRRTGRIDLLLNE